MAIRKRNDFILSILSFAIGLFLFASESTVSGVMLFVGLPFLAEPRTFIQGIGILLMVFSIPLFLKSISLKGERDSGKFRFVYHFIRNPRKRWCFQRFRNLGVGLFPCFFPYGEK